MITKEDKRGMVAGSPEWRASKPSIGGSDASAVIGMNPYKSTFALWCEMTGRTKPFEGNLATEIGQVLEAFVADKFTEMTGIRVVKSDYVYYNDLFPSQHARPDRVCVSKDTDGRKCGLEIKTTSGFNRMKDGKFPEQYYCQCVQYMYIMDYDVWFLAVLVGNSSFHIYMLRRSEDTPVPDWVESDLLVPESEMVGLAGACNAFMAMVNTDTPPLPDGSDSTTEAISEVYAESEPETETELNCDDLVTQYMELKNTISELEDQQKEIGNQIKVRMGENEKAKCGGWNISFKTQHSVGLDTKRLKAERPDIFNEFSKQSSKRPFLVSKKKEKENE